MFGQSLERDGIDMTIPDEIQRAYWAIAAGSKPVEREAAFAIRWAVAEALRLEYLLEFKTHSVAYNKPQRDWFLVDWMAEADRRLREGKDG